MITPVAPSVTTRPHDGESFRGFLIRACRCLGAPHRALVALDSSTILPGVVVQRAGTVPAPLPLATPQPLGWAAPRTPRQSRRPVRLPVHLRPGRPPHVTPVVARPAGSAPGVRLAGVIGAFGRGGFTWG